MKGLRKRGKPFTNMFSLSLRASFWKLRRYLKTRRVEPLESGNLELKEALDHVLDHKRAWEQEEPAITFIHVATIPKYLLTLPASTIELEALETYTWPLCFFGFLRSSPTCRFQTWTWTSSSFYWSFNKHHPQLFQPHFSYSELSQAVPTVDFRERVRPCLGQNRKAYSVGGSRSRPKA